MMKKGIRLIVLICLIGQSVFAQFCQINSAYVFPSNPTNIDSLYFVTDLNFTYSNCNLINSFHFITGDTLQINSTYCFGNIASLCYSIDTVNLGVIPSGNYTIRFKVAATAVCNGSPSPSTNMLWETVDTISVGMFTGLISANEKSCFNLYPNPTSNSAVNLSTSESNPYKLSCYNNIGKLVFEMNNLTGNQNIGLPDEKGMYLIKIVDTNNHLSIFKCASN